MNKRLVALVCLLLWITAAALFAGPEQQEELSKAKSKRAGRGLVRSDLLQHEPSPLQPPLRNIFAPLRPGSRPGQPGLPDQGIQADSSGEGSEDPDAEAGETLPWVPNLRYIGYIRSSERTVAVIIIEGEALAVKPGELISEGVTIIKITPEEIVYQGSDAVSRTVSLEGEDR